LRARWVLAAAPRLVRLPARREVRLVRVGDTPLLPGDGQRLGVVLRRHDTLSGGCDRAPPARRRWPARAPRASTERSSAARAAPATDAASPSRAPDPGSARGTHPSCSPDP